MRRKPVCSGLRCVACTDSKKAAGPAILPADLYRHNNPGRSNHRVHVRCGCLSGSKSHHHSIGFFRIHAVSAKHQGSPQCSEHHAVLDRHAGDFRADGVCAQNGIFPVLVRFPVFYWHYPVGIRLPSDRQRHDSRSVPFSGASEGSARGDFFRTARNNFPAPHPEENFYGAVNVYAPRSQGRPVRHLFQVRP